MLLAGSLLLSVLLAKADPFGPVWLVGCLLCMNAVSEAVPVRIGPVRFVPTDVSVVLALVLLGPLPALVVCCSGLAIDAGLRRADLKNTLTNVACASTCCAVSSGTFALAEGVGWTEPGRSPLVVTVLLVVAVYDLTGALSVWVTNERGMRELRTDLLVAYRAMVPYTVVTALILAGAVHAYYTLGPGVVLVLGGVQVALAVLLRPIERSTQLQAELTTAQEERDRSAAAVLDAATAARGKLQAALHDEAMQTLLAAKQELCEVREGGSGDLRRVARNLDAGLLQLRTLMAGRGFDAHPTPLQQGLKHALGRLLDQGVSCDLDIQLSPSTRLDPLLLQLGAECIANTAKHARARHFAFQVRAEGASVQAQARDDGVGFDVATLPTRLASGHIGIALMIERVNQFGGTMTIDSAPNVGTRISIELPPG